MLPITKLYVDSRFKSSDSVSDSDFKIDIPINLLMPEHTGFYIDDVSIPVSWYTIDANRNNKLWFTYIGVQQMVEIPPGNYSLVTLNTAIADAMNKATAIMQPVGNKFQSDPSISTNTIGVKGLTASNFSIYTDEQLINVGVPTPLNTINEVLRNFTPKVCNNTSPFTSGYVDLFPIRNVYITSTGLGNFNTLSVSGERSIIKKVPVTAGYGEIVFDQAVVGMDYLDCSRQTLSRVGFQLKDVFGNVIKLHGHHWSFSIVFSRIQEIM
jgi:hypothetical protein